MADTIPNLWPDDISVDVLTPLAILKAQAGSLSRITKGLLEAEVKVESAVNTSGKTFTQIHFDLFAPALNRSGYRILTARHPDDMAYPTSIASDYFSASTFDLTSPENEREFLDSLKDILQSRRMVSLIQSLIARSNEMLVSDIRK